MSILPKLIAASRFSKTRLLCCPSCRSREIAADARDGVFAYRCACGWRGESLEGLAVVS